MNGALANALLVGSGGFAGALLRYGLSGLLHRQLPLATFPYGTLAVNAIGCLLIGVLAGLDQSRQILTPELRTFALIGVLGGFTTFSTFGYETFAMAGDGEHLRASLNIGLHVTAALGSVWLGYALVGSR